MRYTDKDSGRIKDWISRDYERAFRVVKFLQTLATLPFALLTLFAIYRAVRGVEFFGVDTFGLIAVVFVFISYTVKHLGAALFFASVILICNLLLQVNVDGISAKDVNVFVKQTQKLATLTKNRNRGYIVADQGELVLYNTKGEPVRRVTLTGRKI